MKRSIFLYTSVILTVIIGTAILAWYMMQTLDKDAEARISQLRVNYENELINTLRGRVETVHSMIKSIADSFKNENDAKKIAIATISPVRFDSNNYIWIHRIDFGKENSAFMFVHAAEELKFKDLSGLVDLNVISKIYINGEIIPKSDTGKYNIKPTDIFKRFNDVCLKNGQGIVRYFWPKIINGKLGDIGYKKISFVKYYPEWSWVIGAGEYADHIDRIVNEKEKSVRSEQLVLVKNITGIIMIILISIVIIISILIRKAVKYQIAELKSEVEQRKTAEKALIYSEQRYRSLFENMPIGLYRTNLDGQILEFNQAAKDMFGFPQDVDPKSTNIINLYTDSEDRKQWLSIMNKKGIVKNYEVQFKRYDGKKIYILNNGRIIQDDQGHTIFFEGSLEDITERKLAEKRSQTFSRILRILSEVNQTILHTKDEMELLNKVCNIIVQKGEYQLAWIGLPQWDEKKLIKPVVKEGKNLMYLDEISLSWNDKDNAKELTGLAICNNKPVTSNNIKKEPNTLLWQKKALEYGFNSAISIPIIIKNNVFGALSIYSNEIDSFLQDEIDMLSELAYDISYGITYLRAIWEHTKTEEELRESEERWRRLVENIPASIAVHSEGRIIFVNKAGLKLFGAGNLSEIYNKPMIDFIHPDYKDIMESRVSKMMQSDESVEMVDEKFIILNGSTIDVEATAIPITYLKAKSILTVFWDVTKRKGIEEALRSSEERFRALYRDNPSMLFTLDPNGKILSVNDFGANQLGYKTDELEGESVLKVFYEKDKLAVIDKMKVCLQNRWKVFNWEFRKIRKDGSILWVEEYARAIVNSSGDLNVLVVCQDITERKTMEETLRNSETELKALFAAMTDFVAVLDLEGRYIKIAPTNPSLHYKPSFELIGKTLHEIFPKDTADTFYSYIQFALKISKPVNIEYSLPISGSEKWFAAVLSPMTKDTILLVARDITEKKKAEEERLVLEDQLRQSQKMESIGRLAGGIAHDFNNLLTAITGNISLGLIDLQKNKVPINRLNGALKAAESASTLTQQLLVFSRKQIIEPKVLNLNDVIKHLEKMLPRLIGEDVHLILNLADNVDAIKADKSQIEQIIINLAVNARDAMPNGGKLKIETENVYLDESYCQHHAETIPGEYVKISVSDTGVGIKPEIKKHLFEPFFTTKPQGKGTGLGLATVYGAVNQNNGRIEVYSEVNFGTTFKIYFPRIIGETKDEKSASESIELRGGNETILFVEDDLSVRSFAENALEELGYQVISCANSKDAINKLNAYEGKVHLLLTDVILPDLNGLELAKKVKELRPDIKILYSSGYTADVIAHHGILEPGIKLLGKPYTIDILAKILREVLD